MGLDGLNLWPWYHAEQSKRYRAQVAAQYECEIEWTKRKIEELTPLLSKRPSTIRQINDLKRQIRERELMIAFGEQGS